MNILVRSRAPWAVWAAVMVLLVPTLVLIVANDTLTEDPYFSIAALKRRLLAPDLRAWSTASRRSVGASPSRPRVAAERW